jgi:hypothetical protein
LTWSHPFGSGRSSGHRTPEAPGGKSKQLSNFHQEHRQEFVSRRTAEGPARIARGGGAVRLTRTEFRVASRQRPGRSPRDRGEVRHQPGDRGRVDVGSDRRRPGALQRWPAAFTVVRESITLAKAGGTNQGPATPMPRSRMSFSSRTPRISYRRSASTSCTAAGGSQCATPRLDFALTGTGHSPESGGGPESRTVHCRLAGRKRRRNHPKESPRARCIK